jgi:hypothetical protein
MRAHEFITEGKTGLRGGGRADADDSFMASHPGMIAPAGRGDLYIGRYYDFYRVASLAGMDPDELDKVDDINFFGNLPVFSAYTPEDREKLVRAMKKLGMDPKDWIPGGSVEKSDTHAVSPVSAFKGYPK